MVNTQFSYSDVVPGKISDAVSRLFADMRNDGSAYTRSASGNVIILVSDPSQNNLVDEFIDSLAIVHPSRYFVIVHDAAATSIRSELAARCFGVTKKEYACSEIVRLSGSQKHMDAMAQITRAQLMSGVGIELYLFDPKIPEFMLQKLGSLADLALYDSGLFDARPDVLTRLSRSFHQSVDVQWLLIGPWRDEIRRIFDRPASQAALPALTEISIQFSSQVAEGNPACALLLAGWFANRLELKPSVRKENEIKLRSSFGDDISLSFCREAGQGESAILGVRFNFGEKGIVELRRVGAVLESVVDIAPSYRTSHPFEAETREQALRRYFLIGESTTNYLAAFRLGLTLR